jgi:hypothetical protein
VIVVVLSIESTPLLLNFIQKSCIQRNKKRETELVRTTNYGRKQRVLLAFAAGLVDEHPLASASCAILRTSTATTATSPNVATIANIVSIVLDFMFFNFHLT